MSTIDIRNLSGRIEKIVFADNDPDNFVAVELKYLPSGYGGLDIVDEQGCCVRVKNEDIDNLILALQKAKELGWGK